MFDAWLTYFPEIKSHRIEGWNNAREATLIMKMKLNL